MGLYEPHVVESLSWVRIIFCGEIEFAYSYSLNMLKIIKALVLLMGSALSESGTLLMAYLDTKQNASKLGISFWNYVRQGYKPSVNVVLLEDIAAVFGVFIAGSCMTLTYVSGNPIYDCIGSLLIGGVMVCYFIKY
jgi:zinc transporter 9